MIILFVATWLKTLIHFSIDLSLIKLFSLGVHLFEHFQLVYTVVVVSVLVWPT